MDESKTSSFSTFPPELTKSFPSGSILDRAGNVACGGGGVLTLLRVQPESGKPMDARSAINGGHLAVGARLGTK